MGDVAFLTKHQIRAFAPIKIRSHQFILTCYFKFRLVDPHSPVFIFTFKKE